MRPDATPATARLAPGMSSMTLTEASSLRSRGAMPRYPAAYTDSLPAVAAWMERSGREGRGRVRAHPEREEQQGRKARTRRPRGRRKRRPKRREIRPGRLATAPKKRKAQRSIAPPPPTHEALVELGDSVRVVHVPNRCREPSTRRLLLNHDKLRGAADDGRRGAGRHRKANVLHARGGALGRIHKGTLGQTVDAKLQRSDWHSRAGVDLPEVEEEKTQVEVQERLRGGGWGEGGGWRKKTRAQAKDAQANSKVKLRAGRQSTRKRVRGNEGENRPSRARRRVDAKQASSTSPPVPGAPQDLCRAPTDEK